MLIPSLITEIESPESVDVDWYTQATDWTDVGKTPGTANIDGIAIDASSDVPLTSEK